MPGQGYHISTGKIASDKFDKKIWTSRFITGLILPDSLNQVVGGRRVSHFTGGAGMRYPEMEKLNNLDNINYFDNQTQKSYITDPMINMNLFEELNSHLSDDDPFKMGIRLHLFGDYLYDKEIVKKFDLSRQDENIVIYDGKILDESGFRKMIYSFYPNLDQLSYIFAGLDKEDIDLIKKVVDENLPPLLANFINKYLNFNPEKVWTDGVFKDNEIKKIVEESSSIFEM